MQVTAKITGYHPATGHHLEEGETYTINPDQFSDQVFTTAEAEPEPEAEEGGETE